MKLGPLGVWSDFLLPVGGAMTHWKSTHDCHHTCKHMGTLQWKFYDFLLFEKKFFFAMPPRLNTKQGIYQLSMRNSQIIFTKFPTISDHKWNEARELQFWGTSKSICHAHVFTTCQTSIFILSSRFYHFYLIFNIGRTSKCPQVSNKIFLREFFF